MNWHSVTIFLTFVAGANYIVAIDQWTKPYGRGSTRVYFWFIVTVILGSLAVGLK